MHFAIWHNPETSIDNYYPINPVNYSLEQNYPNPFNQFTVIPFELREKSQVKISIYNLLGQKVDELANKT